MGRKRSLLKQDRFPMNDGSNGETLEDGEVASEGEVVSEVEDLTNAYAMSEGNNESDGEISSEGEIIGDVKLQHRADDESDGEIRGVDNGDVVGDGEEQILDGMEEGEVAADTGRAAIDIQVQNDLSQAGMSVAQKDARYFTEGDSVICSSCGVKGHMSYKCPEADDRRCFTCGQVGHNMVKCPYQIPRRSKSCIRRVGAPREPVLSCYVCHQTGHLDCSLGSRKGVLSCYNCGLRGHTGAGCNMPRADVVMTIARDLIDRDRIDKKNRQSRQFKGNSNLNKNARKARESAEFRDLLISRLRQRRPSRHTVSR